MVGVISSMATRNILEERVPDFGKQSGVEVRLESVGGVEAVKRVQAGERFDVVVLAADALEGLIASGRLVRESRVDLARSSVALAVPAGAPHPPIDSEEALRRAVVAARRIGYSSGPSGNQLLAAFARWGIADRIAERLVQAAPGVPVGTLVARGEVELGFQQLSELKGIEGIDVVGTLPAAMGFRTVFAGAVHLDSRAAQAAAKLLAFLASPLSHEAIRRHGMEPA